MTEQQLIEALQDIPDAAEGDELADLRTCTFVPMPAWYSTCRAAISFS